MDSQRTLEAEGGEPAGVAPVSAGSAREQELGARELGLAAPRPTGPLSGRRRPWRWRVAAAVLALERALVPARLEGLLRARLLGTLELAHVRVPVARGRLARGLRVAFLSDLHAGYYMTAGDLERLAERVLAQEPELVCLGGDMVDSSPEELVLLEPFLRRLQAPLGVFGVLGNHEFYPARAWDTCAAFLAERGVTMLVNRGARVVAGGTSVWIAGVDDLTESEPDLAAALDGRRRDEPTLLLSHHPDLFIEAATHAVDLQLSGHTHGGQVRILGWQPLVHSRFGLHRGAFRHGDAHLYVGRGAGVTVLPLRVGARAEATIVHWGGAAE